MLCLLCNTQILIDKGKLLLELCDRLIQYCSQDHEQQNRLTINNEIQRLRQRINEYRTEINHLIIKIKDYGSKLAEDIKTARRRESKVDNAKIVQGVGVTGSALAFMVGLLVGGPLGGTVAVGSIIYGGLRAKKCVEAHSAVQGVVKIREDYETTMNKTEQWYWELCQQQVDVENSFARCQQLVEDF